MCNIVIPTCNFLSTRVCRHVSLNIDNEQERALALGSFVGLWISGGVQGGISNAAFDQTELHSRRHRHHAAIPIKVKTMH